MCKRNDFINKPDFNLSSVFAEEVTAYYSKVTSRGLTVLSSCSFILCGKFGIPTACPSFLTMLLQASNFM